MIKISACIITYNEASNITRCIEALKGVVDEILIVDSFSTDNTVAIAEQAGARVIQRAFKGYGDQKHFAELQAVNHWVLSVDADEVVSPELGRAIKEVKKSPAFDAYMIDILPNYCGAWIRHCGWYPQPKLRLWNREKGAMLVDNVHEGVVLNDVSAPVGRLKGDLLHYSFNTISDHVKKIEHYSEVGARLDVARGKSVSLLKLIFAPKLQFLVDYIIRGGFLDGYYGYIVCRNSAFASFVKYAKIRQYSALKRRGLTF